MKIKVGNYELIHSGTIIAIKDNPISIKLKDEIEGDCTFIMNFGTDNEKKEAFANFTVIDRLTLQIDFKNFDKYAGGGNTELIHLGTLRLLPLYFNYRVFDLTNVGKTLLFNFYVGEEVENGK